MDELEDKRRLQEGKYNRKEVANDFLSEIDGIEEFAISVKYKDGSTGVYASSGNITEILGMFELAKLLALSISQEEE